MTNMGIIAALVTELTQHAAGRGREPGPNSGLLLRPSPALAIHPNAK